MALSGHYFMKRGISLSLPQTWCGVNRDQAAHCTVNVFVFEVAFQTPAA